MPLVYILDTNEFNTYIRKHKNVIVRFTANWCTHCKRSKDQVMNLYEKKNIHMIVVETQKEQRISSMLKIKSLPTMWSYINGERSDVIMTSNSEKIENFFNVFWKKAKINN